MPSVPNSPHSRISVVLPVHDGMPYVVDAVRSLLAQTMPDFELVIGDDGSTDGTAEALARLAADDARIRVLRRDTASGLAASANWVVGETRAPIVAIAHADDLSYPRRLERQLAVLDAEPHVALVGALWNGLDEDGREVRPANAWRLLRPSRFAPFAHSSVMFRRSAFDRAGGYRSEAEYWEDLDLYYRIGDHGGIAVVPEVLCGVRHARSSTRLRAQPGRVEDAVDLMYRSAAARAEGRDHAPLLAAAAAARRLHPWTFMSCGSTRLWSGRSPGVWRRMRLRAATGWNAPTVQTLIWVGWGTLSPRSLRLALRTVLRLGNAAALPMLRGKAAIPWSPHRP